MVYTGIMNTEQADFNNLGNWLKPKIEALQLSIEEFANRCGVSRAAVYFYMNDRARPTTGTMAKICRALGVPLEDGLQQYTPKRVGRPKR